MPPQSIGRPLTLLVLFWFVGACLRITVLAVPPVVPLLHSDLHLTETGIGWLSSLPPMLFAIAAVPGALLIARFGLVPALLTGLLLSAAGSAARGTFASTASLFAATIAMGAGISIVQTVMPPLVRAWFPQRIGLATSVYTNGLLVGEIIPVGLTIPLILPLVQQSWRLDFVVWSLPVLATVLLVWFGTRQRAAVRGAARDPSRSTAALVAGLERSTDLAARPDPGQRQRHLFRHQRIPARSGHSRGPSGSRQQRTHGHQCRTAAGVVSHANRWPSGW